MDEWLRRVLSLAIILVWGLYVIINGIIRHDNIPEVLWLFPAAIISALNIKFGKNNTTDKDKSNVDSN